MSSGKAWRLQGRNALKANAKKLRGDLNNNNNNNKKACQWKRWNLSKTWKYPKSSVGFNPVEWLQNTCSSPFIGRSTQMYTGICFLANKISQFVVSWLQSSSVLPWNQNALFTCSN